MYYGGDIVTGFFTANNKNDVHYLHMKRINPKTVVQKVAKEFSLDFNKFTVPENPEIFAYRFKENVSITIGS